MIKNDIYQTDYMFTLQQCIDILMSGKIEAYENGYAWDMHYKDLEGKVMQEFTILGYSYIWDGTEHGDIYAGVVQRLVEVQNKHKLLEEEGIYLYRNEASGYSKTPNKVRGYTVNTFLNEEIEFLPSGEYHYADYTDSGGGILIEPIDKLKVQIIKG